MAHPLGGVSLEGPWRSKTIALANALCCPPEELDDKTLLMKIACTLVDLQCPPPKKKLFFYILSNGQMADWEFKDFICSWHGDTSCDLST